MKEKIYGGNKPSYGVLERDDDWIELRVYHRNQEMRRLLRAHRADPQYFVGRREAFARSSICAQSWLAEVFKDYGSHFAAGRVHIILDPHAPQPAPDVTQLPRPALPSTPGRTIALVACVGQKKDRPLAAEELYDSDWFHKASAYARRSADAWYILSAKYGLLPPDRTIAPYDETLKAMPASERRDWAHRVLADLRAVLRPGDQVLILAGDAYRRHLVGPIEALGGRVSVPMEGLRIGEQLSWLNRQLGPRPIAAAPHDALADVRRFYAILDELEARVGGKRLFSQAHGQLNWPERGVYFIFEPGEDRTTSGSGPRVVRVGTHALDPGSQSTLWGRLRFHRGTADGGGFHRTSIFRSHVGSALIGHGRWPAEVIARWGQGTSAPREVRAREEPLERAVSRVIGAMSILWLRVEQSRERGFIERNAIALLSNHNRPGRAIDPPTATWLGNWGGRDEIRRSGLWNVNHVGEGYDPEFLDRLAQLVGKM